MDIAAAAAAAAVGVVVAVPAVAAVVDGSEIEFEFGTVVSCEYTGRRGVLRGGLSLGLMATITTTIVKTMPTMGPYDVIRLRFRIRIITTIGHQNHKKGGVTKGRIV